MLLALALQNNAPKISAKTNRNDIPVLSTLVSGSLTFFVVLFIILYLIGLTLLKQ
jgi:amino acid permease